MMRARTLCAKANATLPNDPTYVSYLEELFGRKLDDVRILTPFICDFGNRVKFGKGVFLNHSAMRPDRRLQFLHEGNNVKSILLFLIEAYRHNTRNAPYSMDNLKKKFYAVAFDKISENDQLSMEAAFIGAIHTDKVIWAVDRLFETLRPADVDGQIGQMISTTN